MARCVGVQGSAGGRVPRSGASAAGPSARPPAAAALAAAAVGPAGPSSGTASSVPALRLRPRGAGAGRPGCRAPPVRAAPPAAPAPPAVPAVPEKAPKPRLPALDACRFFLIAYICVGHFVALANPSVFALKLFTQVNVVVGAFFVISGYVAAYVATEVGRYEASPRVRPAVSYTVARVAGFYPLYFLSQLAFLPVYLLADVTYNGWLAAAWHGALTFTLSQAWFPTHAELWNPPMWYLSAFAYSLLVLPYLLPALASFREAGLKKCFAALTVISVLAKVAYSYDLGCWGIMEGVTPPKLHPNHVLFNVLRFNPLYGLVEILMGATAARLVMVGEGAAGAEGAAGRKGGVPPAALAAAMGGLLLARAAGVFALNDMLTRGFLFIPLFCWFLVRVHRVTLDPATPRWSLVRLLEQKPLVYLGNISFVIYIIHGPIGQIFYKRAVATKLWGFVFTKYPGFFYAYLAIVLAASVLVQKFVVESAWFKARSKGFVKGVLGALGYA